MANVLMIEPDAVMAAAYKQAVENDGHRVFWRQDAQSAIDCADEVQPDLVLLELQLAGHNGVEFLYEFRSYAEWRNIPVIIVSMVRPNHPALGEVVSQHLGVVRYCHKPTMRLAELVQAVRDITQSKIAR